MKNKQTDIERPRHQTHTHTHLNTLSHTHTHTLIHSLTHTHTHTLMALFHCMVRHGSLLGGFPLGTVPGTWYFFSTTSAEVPSDPYRYQNVTGKLYWSLIGRRESSLLRQWTIFSEYVFCLYFYLCICVLLQLKTIWSNKCTSRLY